MFIAIDDSSTSINLMQLCWYSALTGENAGCLQLVFPGGTALKLSQSQTEHFLTALESLHRRAQSGLITPTGSPLIQ